MSLGRAKEEEKKKREEQKMKTFNLLTSLILAALAVPHVSAVLAAHTVASCTSDAGACLHRRGHGFTLLHAGLPRELRLKGGSGSSSRGLHAELQDRLKALISQAPVMLFMKGEPDAPQCGFSRAIVGLLREHDVEFAHFDILQDEEVRQGLKQLSNWPTYPQVYAHGELLGGLDVCKELAESGELARIAYTCKDGEEGAESGAGGGEEAVGSCDSPVSANVLEDKIRAELEASVVEAVDESDGCGAKFAVLVVSEKFVGMPVIDRQRAVHAAIKEELPRIHALTLKCKTPEQHRRP